MSTYKMIAMEFARYNKWQNSNVYEICNNLSQAELDLDRGGFFHSLSGTLNHVLHVDRVLLQYIVSGSPPTDFDPNVVPYELFNDLKLERDRLDAEIQQVMDDSPTEWFDEIFSFESKDLERLRQRPRALIISQMFNHQTHHRSQATQMLLKLDMDYGVTDMPYNPLSLS